MPVHVSNKEQKIQHLTHKKVCLFIQASTSAIWHDIAQQVLECQHNGLTSTN